MPDLPVMLRITGRRCVVVGGGAVARRRTVSLCEAGAKVAVIAAEVQPDSEQAFKKLGVTIHRRPYQTGDLDGALLVVIATDQESVNQQITTDAKAAGVLINRTDKPDAGDVTIPAHARRGPVTMAVHTGGVSAAAAATIRDELLGALDADWPRLLEVVGPFRNQIQNLVPTGPLRQELLKRLTDKQIKSTLKQEGPEAVRVYCQQMIDQAVNPGP